MIADILALCGGLLFVLFALFGVMELAAAALGRRAPRCTVCGRRPQLVGTKCAACARRRLTPPEAP